MRYVTLILTQQVISDIESKHEDEVNTLKSDYEQKLLDLEGEQIRQHEELEQRHQRELDDCITGSKDEISLARSEQEAEIKQLQVGVFSFCHRIWVRKFSGHKTFLHARNHFGCLSSAQFFP